jgi:hypothetical protein
MTDPQQIGLGKVSDKTNMRLPVQPEFYPKIDYIFDRAVHVVRRCKELVWELKELVIALLILYLLIKHAGPLV